MTTLTRVHGAQSLGRKKALSDCPWDELAGGEGKSVFGLDEIIDYVGDEFCRQQAVTDCIAQQSEGAFAGKSCFLRDLVGYRIV